MYPLRLISPALLALLISGCAPQGPSAFDSPGTATGGDPEVVARRILDLAAMRQDGMSGVTPSLDGRFIVFSTEEGNLAIQDFESQQIRDLTHDADPLQWSAYANLVSPDGEWIAFTLQTLNPYWAELRVIRADGTEERTVSPPFSGEGMAVESIEPYAWSSDGTTLLTAVWTAGDTNRLDLISLEDGSSRTLKAFDWIAPFGAAISPDGRYVAYDFPPDEDDRATDLYVLAVAGGREVRITDDADVKRIIGWGRDGGAIYYAVETVRAGRTVSSVWRLPMRGSRPDGAPTLVRGDLIGRNWFQLIGDRIFYRSIQDPSRSYMIATVDLDAGRIVVPPSVFAHTSAGEHAATWTEDGLEFAFTRPAEGRRPGSELVLVPASGGEDERVIPLGIGDARELVKWDAQTMFLRGSRRGQPGEVVRADLRTGQATPVVDSTLLALLERAGPTTFLENRRFSPNLPVAYRSRERDGAWEVVAHEVATGVERVLHRESALTREPRLSPDGRQLVFLVYYPGPGAGQQPCRTGSNQCAYNEIHVLSVDGGTSRVVYTGWVGGSNINWTSDSRTLVFDNAPWQGVPTREIWKVDADGSDKALLLTENGVGALRLHPDNRRIVYRASGTENPTEELWVIENLPEVRSEAQPARSH